MNNVPEAVLLASLDFMEQGESIEQILARYPDAKEALRPFLETAVQLASLAPQPSLAAKNESQKAFLAHAKGLKTTPIQPSPFYRFRQLLLTALSLGVVLFLFAVTAVSVSASAIPGDALYPVKRVVEDFRLAQAGDPATAVALREQYRQERIREVQALLRTGRSADVMFEGEVEQIQAESWTVETIQVMLDAETEVVGQPQVGETARVTGRTGAGKLTAATIEMLTSAAPVPAPTQTPEPIPSPLPTATATQEATAVPTAASTLAPTPTQTTTPTSTPTATITPSPQPTSTPTLMPTAPANDNNDNGNDNDDDNDNGNDDNENDNGNDNDDNDNDNDDDGNNNNDNDNDNGNDSSGSGSNGNGNDNENDNGNDNN